MRFAASGPAGSLFRDGCPGGESVADIGARADRVVGRLRSIARAAAGFIPRSQETLAANS